MDTFGIISSACGILGFVYVIFQVFLTIKEKLEVTPKFCIDVNSINLSSFSTDLLHLYYDTKKINSFTSLNLLFWLRGKKIIKKEDLNPIAPICFKIDGKDSEILECYAISVNNKSNNISCEVSQDKKTINFSFEYLGKNDGIFLSIMHSGNPNHYSVSGSLRKQNGKISTKRNLFYHSKMRRDVLSNIVILRKLMQNDKNVNNRKARKSNLVSYIAYTSFMTLIFLSMGVIGLLKDFTISSIITALISIIFIVYIFWPKKMNTPPDLEIYFHIQDTSQIQRVAHSRPSVSPPPSSR